VGEAEPVVEDDRLSELLGEGLNVFADGRDGVFLGARRSVRGFVGCAALLSSAEVAGLGHGRAPEPAAHGVDAAVAPCGLDEPYEGLLCGVLGGRGVSEERAGDAEARRPVVLDDRGEGSLVAEIAERRVERGVARVHSTCMADHEASARGLRPPAGHTSLLRLCRNSRLRLQLGADPEKDLPEVVRSVAVQTPES
jgi:hypothetical protein